MGGGLHVQSFPVDASCILLSPTISHLASAPPRQPACAKRAPAPASQSSVERAPTPNGIAAEPSTVEDSLLSTRERETTTPSTTHFDVRDCDVTIG